MFAVILAVALVLLFIASVQDIRKREVEDYISYTLISASILLRLIWFVIEKDLTIIIYTVPSFAVLFAFSYIMYRFGQWGGGDVKLVAGLSIALSDFMQIFNLFVNFAIIGVLYGVLYTLIRGLRHWRIIADKINKKLPIYFDYSDEYLEWNIVSSLSKTVYREEQIGFITRIPNPFSEGKEILVFSGKGFRGTRAAVLAFIKHNKKIMKGNSIKSDVIANVVQGIDVDSDGIIDEVEFLE
jgi:Flp pilus assembly protein protease CpaA